MPITHGTVSGYKNHKCRCDACKAAKREDARLYNLKNAEQNRARSRKWQLENPEKRKEQTARYREKHREKRRADSLARYYKQMEENPEKVRERRREWKRTEKGRAYQRVANYRRRSLPMSNEVRDWWLSQRNAVCAYCWAAMATEIDHIIPISKGGTNDLDNLVPACRSCNASKNDRTLAEWLEGAR